MNETNVYWDLKTDYLYLASLTADSTSWATLDISKKVDIKPSLGDFFKYGNCALIAIGDAFDIPEKPLKALCLAMGITPCSENDDEDGLTFQDCNKVIRHLSKVYNYEGRYIRNKDKITYETLALSTGSKLLVVFDYHLSFCENHIIFDSYFYSHIPSKVLSKIPTGWWKLN